MPSGNAIPITSPAGNSSATAASDAHGGRQRLDPAHDAGVTAPKIASTTTSASRRTRPDAARAIAPVDAARQVSCRSRSTAAARTAPPTTRRSGWPSAMISRCICDVSISMKPSPIAMKNVKQRRRRRRGRRARASATAAARMQSAVSTRHRRRAGRRASPPPSCCGSACRSRAVDVRQMSRSRSMLKKNGLSSVGAVMLSG